MFFVLVFLFKIILFCMVDDVIRFFIYKDKLGRIVVYVFDCFRLLCKCFCCLVVGIVDFLFGKFRFILNGFGCFDFVNFVVYLCVREYLKFVWEE